MHEPTRSSASCVAALVPRFQNIREMALQVDFLLSRLKVLYERIDDTEDLINIELDHRYLSNLFGFGRDWPVVHGIPHWLPAYICPPCRG